MRGGNFTATPCSTCCWVGERVCYWCLEDVDVIHISVHDHLEVLVVVVGLLVNNEQRRLVCHRLDALYDLLVILGADVRSVYLDDAISGAYVGRHGGRQRVHGADELASLAPLGVQVETVAGEIRPLSKVTQSRLWDIGRQRIAHVNCDIATFNFAEVFCLQLTQIRVHSAVNASVSLTDVTELESRR